MFIIGLAGETKFRFSFILSNGMLWRFTSKQGNNVMKDILPFKPILMSSCASYRHKTGVPTHLFWGWMNLLESLAEFRAMLTYVFWFIRKDIHKDTVEPWKKEGEEQGIAWNVYALLV